MLVRCFMLVFNLEKIASDWHCRYNGKELRHAEGRGNALRGLHREIAFCLAVRCRGRCVWALMFLACLYSFRFLTESARYYGMDAQCPPRWREWLLEHSSLPIAVLPGNPDDALGYLKKDVRLSGFLSFLLLKNKYTRRMSRRLCAILGSATPSPLHTRTFARLQARISCATPKATGPLSGS